MRLVLRLLLLLSCELAAFDSKHDDKEIGNNQWSGEYYQQNSSGQFASGMEFLSSLKLGSLPNVLDIGCGTGEIDAAIAEQETKSYVLGIDSSRDMIETARKAHGHLNNLEFQVQDAQKLDFKKRFNLVISFGCLHWVKGKKKTKVFRGIAQALKPGGVVLIVAAAKITTHALFLAFKDAAQTPNWRETLKTFEPNKEHYPLEKNVIEATMKKVGFQSVIVTEDKSTRTYATKEEFIAWMLTWIGGFPTIAALSTQKQAELVNELAEYYVKHQPVQKDGSIIFNFTTIIAKGSAS